ncbi:MAG TPA: DUF3568 family protein [Burkholderiales bacterium]
MSIRLVLALVFGVLVIGCASTDTVKEAKGQGTTRSYARSYDAVYEATLAAAKKKDLEVVEANKDTGALVLSHGVTLLSWGERIAVFMKAIGSNATQVEIVSKPVLAPLNFPPEWDRILLDQIAEELQKK